MLGLVPDAMVGPAAAGGPRATSRCASCSRTAGPGTAELPLPDGRTAQASLVPVTTPFGEPVGVAAILRDITLLKNLEQMKNDFVNTVSHDLKNPISIIDGTAELMLGRGKDDARRQRRCQRIRDDAQLHGRAGHRPARPGQDRGRARAAEGAPGLVR